MSDRIRAITARGLFEARENPNNMLSNLTRHLDRNRFDVQEFPEWQAGFGDYDRELERVSRLLAEEVRQHDGPLILAGYSGGSHVVKRACLDLDGDDRRKVLRVVLCADPSMPQDMSAASIAYGYGDIAASTLMALSGIAGPEPLWMPAPNRVVYVVDKGDPICCCPPGSPLRSLAAFLTSVGPDVGMPLRMRVKLAAAAVGRRYDLGAYGEALALFRAYSGNPSAHIAPYPPLLSALGKQINREVGA